MAQNNRSRWGGREGHRQYQHEEMSDREQGTRDSSEGRDRPRGAGPEGTSQHHESHEHQNVGRGHAQHQQASQQERRSQQDRGGQQGRQGQRERQGQQGQRGRQSDRQRRRGGTDTRELGEDEHMGRRYGQGYERGRRGRGQ